MNTENGYENFKNIMGAFLLEIIQDIDMEEIKKNGGYLEQSEFQYQLYHQYNEIIMSMDSLKLIEKFISIKPPKVKLVNDSNYLMYHVHNYIQEMYILEDRLKQFIELIVASYTNLDNKSTVLELKKTMIKFIKSNLENFTKYETGARSQHVHYKRFKDEEIQWLETTIFLSTQKDEYIVESKKAYYIAKMKWLKIIKNNNKEIVKLLNIYFTTLSSIIAPDGKIHLPEDFKNIQTN